MRIIHLELLNKKELKQLKTKELDKLFWKLNEITGKIAEVQNNIEDIECDRDNAKTS